MCTKTLDVLRSVTVKLFLIIFKYQLIRNYKDYQKA